MEDKKKSFWKLKVESLGEANSLISETAWTFVILGLILFPLSVFIPNAWLDGVIYIMVGSLLAYKRNIWVACIVILLASVTVYMTAMSRFTGSPGGTNLFLAAIIFWSSIKYFQAVRYIKQLPVDHGEVLPDQTRFQKIGAKIFPTLFWVMLSALIAIGVLMVIGFNYMQENSEPISGELRSDFISATIAGCTTTVKENKDNANLTEDYIAEWCSCNANEMADHITNGDLMQVAENSKTVPEVMEKISSDAVAVCQQRVPTPFAE